VEAFRQQAHGIAGGPEPELTLVVDAMFPMARLLKTFKEFGSHFPSVQLRIHVEALGAATRFVLDGQCTLGILASFASQTHALKCIPLLAVELVPVAAPGHPLGRLTGRLEPEAFRDHVQLVLTDRSALTGDRDHGVLATQTWRLGDLGAKHAMVLAGLGWGSMPMHMVAEDLRQGRLIRLHPTIWDGSELPVRLSTCAAHRNDGLIGPAAQWMLERLACIAQEPQTTLGY
jgi:DNA-binding transcriptional LysR family regulator